MLLDSASLYFRAFYGVPETLTAPDGTPVNAVRGLLDMITRLVRARHPDRFGVVDQLEQVAVAGYDLHRLRRAGGQGADHVVRLVPGSGRHGHPGCGQYLLDDRHLHGERGRHLLFVLAFVRQPVRLVRRQGRHPERRPPVRVHAGHQPGRVPRPDQPGDHVE